MLRGRTNVEILDSFYGLFLGEWRTFLIVLSVIMLCLLGFVGAPLIVSTLVVGLILVGFKAPAAVLIGYAAIAVLLNLAPLRRLVLSAPIMKLMKALKLIPSISQTEREALEAGVVWVDSELFSGKPDFKRMLNESYPKLTAEEQAFLDGPVEDLCRAVSDWEIWQKRDIPPAAWDIIKREKFLGMIIPKQYGGLEFSALAHSSVIAKLASRSIPACISVMVPNSLGPAELLIHYGTDEQKKKLLPKLASGEEIPCFALTEPGAGSDAGSIQSRGEVFRGEDGKLYIRLNWNKRWITLAAISTTLGLAFRLYDPKNLLGKGEDVGITCALIPSKTPGVVLGRRHDPLGVPFYNCPTQGKDVVVPIDAIIGGQEMAGKGWLMLMESLGAGRGVSLPAQSAGGAKFLSRMVGAHAAIRKQFGLAIGKFEGIEEPLARIAGFTYLLEALRKFTCGALDQGIKPPVITAIAKYHSTELSRKIVNDAMDVLGGAGISRGPRNVVAHTYIAIPIGITVEGANILTRTLMIFGQGAMRAHPFAFKEVKALEEGNLADFDRAFWGHMGHIGRNFFRSLLLSVSRGYLASSPVSGPVSKYYKRLAWASASFAFMSDIAMGTLGGKLKTKEKLTGRFADVLSWLYISTAVLRRWEAEGRKEEDIPFVDFCCKYGLTQIQHAFDGIFSNFHAPLIGPILRGPVNWWSRLNSLSSEPSDALTHTLAKILQTPGDQRDRLTPEVFLSQDMADHTAQLERTFVSVKQAEEAERKIKRAIRKKKLPKRRVAEVLDEAYKEKIITDSEKSVLETSEKLRWECIQVDDFSQDQYLSHST